MSDLAAHDLSPLVQSVEIDASPERVFELFTDPDQLVRWWPDAVRLDPRVGGPVRVSAVPLFLDLSEPLAAVRLRSAG